jgi:hypothetical protein
MRACIERGRVWQAEHYVGALRDDALSLPASVRGCPRYRPAATTTSWVRPWLDSRIRTSARSTMAALRAALAAPVVALIREGAEARLAHGDAVA